MRAPTEDASETVTGFGGTGVELMLAGIGGSVLQGHPMIPMLQVSANSNVGNCHEHDLDVVLGQDQDQEQAVAALLDCITQTLSQRYQPKLVALGNVRFQLTRGELGVSL
jgi:altronate dehydratase